MIGNIYRIKTI